MDVSGKTLAAELEIRVADAASSECNAVFIGATVAENVFSGVSQHVGIFLLW